mgnify:CR=1 FL=1
MARMRAYWDSGFDNAARHKKSKGEARRRREDPDAQAKQVAAQIATLARKNAVGSRSSLLHIKQ